MPHPVAAGKSSFDLIDLNTLKTALDLQGDIALLDLACGAGNYAIEIARQLAGKGVVHALDLWAEGIASLKEKADSLKLGNVEAAVCDVSKSLPLDDGSVDVCLMATVLHDLISVGTHEGALNEVARVLKPSGRLAVIEFKKIPGPPGPPEKIRLAPEELERILSPWGFTGQRNESLGDAVYLSIFLKG